MKKVMLKEDKEITDSQQAIILHNLGIYLDKRGKRTLENVEANIKLFKDPNYKGNFSRMI